MKTIGESKREMGGRDRFKYIYIGGSNKQIQEGRKKERERDEASNNIPNIPRKKTINRICLIYCNNSLPKLCNI